MLFNFALISSFLLASAVPADRCEGRRSRSVHRVEQATRADTASDGVEYNPNWAGAVWDAADGTFDAIVGTFTVPVQPSGYIGSTAAVWVGIDGVESCAGGFFQTGVTLTVTDDGATYSAWTSWYPGSTYLFPDFQVSAGDVVGASLIVVSPTYGTAVIENVTSGQSAFMSLNSTFALCGQSAEWIIAEANEYGDPLPLANFGKVIFTDAEAMGPAGAYIPGNGATVYNIEQNNQALTSVSIDGSSVTISYL